MANHPAGHAHNTRLARPNLKAKRRHDGEKPFPDACCHEKVAFSMSLDVRCTLNATVSVQSRRITALSYTVSYNPTECMRCTNPPRSRFRRSRLLRGTHIASLSNRP